VVLGVGVWWFGGCPPTPHPQPPNPQSPIPNPQYTYLLINFDIKNIKIILINNLKIHNKLNDRIKI
jgi:hypothetical protein